MPSSHGDNASKAKNKHIIARLLESWRPRRAAMSFRIFMAFLTGAVASLCVFFFIELVALCTTFFWDYLPAHLPLEGDLVFLLIPPLGAIPVAFLTVYYAQDASGALDSTRGHLPGHWFRRFRRP